MTRTIQDPNLMLWEAYSTPGDFGFPDGSRMVFQCLTEPGRRARMVELDGDISDVEKDLVSLSDAELLGLFERTEEVS